MIKQGCFSVFVLSMGLIVSLAGATEKRAFSFENSHELKSWEFKGGATAKIVSKGATHGTRSLKVKLPAGNKIWPGMYLMIPSDSWLKDWSSFDTVKFDLMNPTSSPMQLTVTIFDGVQRKHYVAMTLVNAPAKKTTSFCFSLAELMANSRTMDASGIRIPGDRFDLTNMGEFVICVDGLTEPGEFYVDNIRFGSDNPPRILRSHAKPSTFSPNKDGWLDSMVIFAEFSKITPWRLQIINSKNHKILRTWSGRENYLDINWDATDSAGKLLPSGDYYAEIAVFDSLAKKNVIDTKQVGIKIVHEQTRPHYMVWPASNLVKIMRDDPAGIYSIQALLLKSAKNETASFQVAIQVAGESLNDIRIETPSLVTSGGKVIDESNITVYRERYTQLKALSISRPGARDGSWWPDGLIPVEKPFSLSREDGNCVLWVDVKVPSDAVAGDYKGHISVIPSNGSPTKVDIKLKVWKFALPDVSSLPSAFGLDYLSPAHRDQWRLYADLLLEHRLTFFRGNLSFDDWTPYVDRVPAYRAPVNFVGRDKQSDETVEKVVAILQEARKRGGSLWKKHYIYCNDEPQPHDVAALVSFYKKLKSRVEGVRILLTTKPEERLYGLVDIWCPYPDTLDLDVMRERQRAGDSVWWYHMPLPLYPYPSYQMDADCAGIRIIPWMTAYWGLEGILYWDTSFEHCPWRKDVSADIWNNPNHNGDGILIYPGDAIGLNKPVPSLRLKVLRDGMEDYEYLQLLRKLVNKKASLKAGRIIKPVPGDWSDPGMKEIRKYLEQIIVNKLQFARNTESFEDLKAVIAERIVTLQSELLINSK